MPIVNRVADLHDEIIAWRRDMHAHPELLYDVHRTAARWCTRRGATPGSTRPLAWSSTLMCTAS